jgi:hypothetical protein
MKGYDRWKLASPYDGQPDVPGAEDLLGLGIRVEERWAEVDSYFCEEDEDEGGRYQLVYYEATFVDGKQPRTHTISEFALHELLEGSR